MDWFRVIVLYLMRLVGTLLGVTVDLRESLRWNVRFARPCQIRFGWIVSNLMRAEARIRPLPHIETPLSNGPPLTGRAGATDWPAHALGGCRSVDRLTAWPD